MSILHPLAAASSTLLSRIKEDIAKANNERVKTEVVKRYACTPEEFHAIGEFLEESPCKGVSFNAAAQKLRFVLMPTIIHGACGAWLSGWQNKFPEEVRSYLRFQGETDVESLGVDGQSKKIPDISIHVRDRSTPTIALEVGYSESYADLVEDATLLLEGSEGRVGVVILVKLSPLTPTLQAIQSGFVEVHVYDQELHQRKKFKSRMQLYPPPKTHSRQKIVLPWQAVLRGQRAVIEPTTQSAPPLLLDELRSCIDDAVRETTLLRSKTTVKAEADESIF